MISKYLYLIIVAHTINVFEKSDIHVWLCFLLTISQTNVVLTARCARYVRATGCKYSTFT